MNGLAQTQRRTVLHTFAASCTLAFLLVLALQASPASASAATGSITSLRDLSHDTCATVTASTDSAAIAATSCGSAGDAQTYQFVKLTGGNYRVYTWNESTYCLSHHATAVTSDTCSTDSSQEWLVQAVATGMTLQTPDGASCLSDPAGWDSNATTMQPCTAASNQIFQNSILPANQDPTTCGSTPNGATIWVNGAMASASSSATAQQCPFGGTVTSTWTNQTQEVCTNGTLTSTGQIQKVNLIAASPVCNAAPAASCGSTPSGSTVWVNGTMASSSVAATPQQCPNGGTITSTWTNQTQQLCTNGNLTSTGQTQQINLVTAAPVCTAAPTPAPAPTAPATSSGITLTGISPLRDLLHDICATILDQTANAPITANSCGGSAGQNFQFAPLADGKTRIQTFSGTTYCLAYSGATVVSTTCSNSLSQEWSPQVVTGGMLLKTSDGTSCLADPADWNANTTTMQPCNAPAGNQIFKITLTPTTSSAATSVPSAAGNITIFPASQPAQVAPPGATINIGANFTAVHPLTTPYTLTLYLTDSTGNTLASVSDTLAQFDSSIPTSLWQGLITISRPLTVPSIADGAYQLMAALTDPSTKQPLALSPAAGVTQDNQYRYAIGTLIVKASAPVPSLLAPPTLNLTGFTLTFDDEFQTLDLSDSFKNDGAKWYTHNQQCCMQSTDGSGTYMYGLTDPVNPYSIVPGGGLDIRLQKINNNWSSGVMTSVDNAGVGFSQQYGYFEMSARFPSGLDTWPAFWMFNTASKASNAPQGEIDIVEYIANPSFINTIRTTLHDYSGNTVIPYTWNQVPNPSDGNLHTYGLLWTAETMTFYFDGSVYFACPTPAIMQQPYYILVDLGLGSGYPTNTTPAVNDMIVQHVRAYALPPS